MDARACLNVPRNLGSRLGAAWAAARTGRAIKAIRLASAEQAVPVAGDRVNQNISIALRAQAYREPPSPDELATAAISLDAVDPQALELALADISWPELLRLRKEVLPQLSRLHTNLKKAVWQAGRPQNLDISVYREELRPIRGQYMKTQHGLRELGTSLDSSYLRQRLAPRHRRLGGFGRSSSVGNGLADVRPHIACPGTCWSAAQRARFSGPIQRQRQVPFCS